ncbi:MAG: hypothetical protein F4114_16320 [Rhodospirillaceae bacterium]|nr:hypothetical protein [Rhodospirillaceae bacterium]MYB12038.1 hypothetical protein [Rhodospirillaceae bacterium]MYI50636.1 hypothetical protein [Rhodospirillaceae bacterium]
MSQRTKVNWHLFASLCSLVLSIVIALTGVGFWLGGFTSSFERLADNAVEKAMDDLLGPGTIIPKFALERASVPPGWVVCSQSGTPDLQGRFLIGTTDIKNAGKPVGEPGPGWRAGVTGGESLGKLAPEKDGNDDFADNIGKGQGVSGDRNWYHEHSLPSVQVVFLCRQPDVK